MKRFLLSTGNFFQDLIIRTAFGLSLIYAVALISLTFNKYTLFLNNLLIPLISLLAFFVLFFIVLNSTRDIIKNNKIDFFIIFFIGLFCIFNAFNFSESLVEGGHDQGGYLESGVLLANTGSLFLDSTKEIIAPTVPGWRFFGENKLKHAFIPGNTVFISIFYKFFGLTGIKIANSFLLFFSASIIYFLCKRIRSWKTGLLFLLFFLFNYYTIYFSRSTYVENLQLFFVWLYVYLFIEGYFKRELHTLLFASLPIFLALFLRQETPFYILIYFIIIVYVFIKNRLSLERNYAIAIVGLLMTNALLIYSYYFLNNGTFLGNDAIDSIRNVFLHPISGDLSWGHAPYNAEVFRIMFLYYAFGSIFLLIAVVSIISSFFEENIIKKKISMITILILPQFAFLYKPEVALYLPWAMRRFWGVFIPFIFILLALFLTNKKSAIYKSRALLIVIMALLFISSSLAGLSIFGFPQGKGILNFQKELASKFNKNTDLIIFFDRYNYESWGPPLYFLYGLPVVFDRGLIFDNNIYATLMHKYKNVYILTSINPANSLRLPFGKNLDYMHTISSDVFKVLNSAGVTASCDVRQFNAWPQTFSGYYQFKDLCIINNPPIDKYTYQINLNAYKVKEGFKEKFLLQYYNPNYKINNLTWENE